MKKSISNLKNHKIFIILFLLAAFICAGGILVSEDRYAVVNGEKNAIEIYSEGAQKATILKLAPNIMAPFTKIDLASNGYSMLVNAETDDGIGRIFLVDLAADNSIIQGARLLLPLDHGTQIGGTFFPDSTKIAYYSPIEDGKYQLYLADISTGETEKLIVTDTVSRLSFSTDKRQMLIISKKDGKNTLQMIPIAGGRSIDIRPEVNISAAVFSPTSDDIAAVVFNTETELYDIEIFPLLSSDGNIVVSGVKGIGNIIWFDDDIIFTAESIAETDGPIFVYNVKSSTLKKLELPISFRTVSDISKNMAAYRDADPNTQAIPFVDTSAGRSRIEELLTRSMVFLSPRSDVEGVMPTVSGLVDIDILTRSNIRTILIKVNGQFVQEGEVINNQYSYTLDTTALRDMLVTEPLVRSYSRMKKYADGTIIITAEGKDQARRVVATETISVNLSNNSLSALKTPLPFIASWLHNSVDRADIYHITANSVVQDNPIAGLNASLSARVRLFNAGGNDDNSMYIFQTAVAPMSNELPLRYGANGSATLPETENRNGMNVITAQGGIMLSPARNVQANNLALISMPLPEPPKQIAPQGVWSNKIYVVADLFSREAALVDAANTYETIEEWGTGELVAVIRSDFLFPSGTRLFNSPTNIIPGVLGSRYSPKQFDEDGKELVGAPPPIDMRDQQRSFATTSSSLGVRYTWMNIATGKVVKMQDYIMYRINSNDAAAQPAVTGGITGGNNQQRTINYLVSYTYMLYTGR